MRRVISAVILALFIAQSSGAAIAAPKSEASYVRPLGLEIQVAFSQALQVFQSTEIGAFLMGQGARYEIGRAHV